MKVNPNSSVFPGLTCDRGSGAPWTDPSEPGIPLRLYIAKDILGVLIADERRRDFTVSDDVQRALEIADELIAAHNATCGEVR